uniref:Uncharacterized protein n=1 Tax=Archaeoglobus fulgidus TaxID=2234 RepID=A0A7J2TJL5_ARCFL
MSFGEFDPVVFTIAIGYLILTIFLSYKLQRPDFVSLAISIARSGIRFPCRFIKDVYGICLSKTERICVKEITECEGCCEDCLE